MRDAGEWWSVAAARNDPLHPDAVAITVFERAMVATMFAVACVQTKDTMGDGCVFFTVSRPPSSPTSVSVWGPTIGLESWELDIYSRCFARAGCSCSGFIACMYNVNVT